MDTVRYVLLIRILKLVLFVSMSFSTLGQNLFAKEKLVLGTWEWSPITDSKLEGYGIASEIITKAYEAEGVEVEIKFYPWKRGELLLQSNELDALFPYTKTAEREKKYLFSDSVLTVKTKFFYMKDLEGKFKKPEFNSYEELKEYSISGVLGYFYQEEFDKAGLDVEYVGTDEQNLKRLVKGRVDIIPMANYVGWYLINKNHPQDYYRFDTVDYDLPGKKVSSEEIGARVMVLKDNPDADFIIQTYNRGLKKIKQNGEYRKILRKYGARESDIEKLIEKDPSKDVVITQDAMKMAYFNHYPHTYETDVDGKPAGAAVRYVEAVAKEMGVKVEWVGPLPYKRVLHYNKTGFVDGFVLSIKEDDFFEYNLLTDKPYHSVETILVLRKAYPLNEITDGDDIKGFTIGWLVEEYLSPFMAKNKHNIEFDYVKSDTHWEQQLRKLLVGRIDAVYDLNQYTLPGIAKKMGIAEQIKVLKLPDKPIDIYVAFSKASPNGKLYLKKFNEVQKTFPFYNEEYKKFIEMEMNKVQGEK